MTEQTEKKADDEKNEKKAREAAQQETDPQIKANHENIANSYLKLIKLSQDDIEVTEKEIEQIQKAITEAEAKYQECLKNNPK